MAAIESWIASGNEVTALWSAHPGKWKRFRKRLAWRGLVAVDLPDLSEVALPDAADTLVTAMTHAIVPARLIDHFDRRALNLHPALLPQCRGPAPRQAMLVDGTSETDGGVTVHVLAPRIDGGPVVGRTPVPIGADDDWWSWDRKLAIAAAGLFADEVTEYLSGRRDAEPQQPNAGRYRKVRRGEFSIGPRHSLDDVSRLMNALRRYPVRLSVEVTGGKSRTMAVETLGRPIGPPEGKPAIVGRGHVITDLSDVRIRFGRPGMVQKLRRRLLETMVLARASRIGRLRGQRKGRVGTD